MMAISSLPLYSVPPVSIFGVPFLCSIWYLCNSEECLLFSIFAGGGIDYNTPNPTTFTFTSAQTLQCTNIPINDDTLCEGDDDETFTIQLSSTDPGAVLSPLSATVSINDNDSKSLLSSTHKKCTQ